MALLGLQEVKDYLKITTADEDQIVTDLITDTQDILESWLGRELESAQYTEDFDGDDTNVRILNHRPVVSVSQVLISIDNSNEISSSGYVIYETGGILKLKTILFPAGLKNCRVVYTAGFTSATLPGALKNALKELAALVYKISPHGDYRLGKSSINQPEGGTVNYTEKLPAGTLKAISKYRDIRF